MLKPSSIDAFALAKSVHSEMIALRRDFHMHPEIGFAVERTAGIVADKLESYGLKVKRHVGVSGVVADLNISETNKWIALRADMDALPIQELNEISYKSKTPMQAHKCGHDAHTAMLLGAAKILASLKDHLKVNVRFIFQPSEEVWPGGAPGMIEDNVLDGVDEIYALHVWPTLEVGKYGICVGPTMAQADGFDITIIGHGGHAASPHLIIDPIVVSAHLVQSLQTIVSRNIDPNDSAVLTITQVHAGSAYNVVPDICTLGGTVRTYRSEVKDLIRNRMEKIIAETASAHGAVGSLSYKEGYPPVYNNEEMSKKVKLSAEELVGASHVDFPAKKVMFGEDFAYYAQKSKGCFIHLGCRNEAKGFIHQLHEPLFDIDEDCLIYGAALHIKLALNSN